MPAREGALDPVLAIEQPVHRAQQLRLCHLAQPELALQRGLREPAGHRQLRARADHQLADHRHTQIPLAAALP